MPRRTSTCGKKSVRSIRCRLATGNVTAMCRRRLASTPSRRVDQRDDSACPGTQRRARRHRNRNAGGAAKRAACVLPVCDLCAAPRGCRSRLPETRHRRGKPARRRLHATAAVREWPRPHARRGTRGRGHPAAGVCVAQARSHRSDRERAARGGRDVSFTGPLAYAAIFAAAVVEGEVVFIAAAVLVAAGKLNALAVMTFGALGAATGDQIIFYALRGRIEGWLRRSRAVVTRHSAIVSRVQRHQSLLILAIRFAPGLRIAITAACAYGNISAVRFTTLNLVGALMWAAVLLTLVSHIGPGVLRYAGISGIWASIVPALLLLAFGWWISRELPAPAQGPRLKAQDSRQA